jgi:hypothetical protein
VCAERREKKRLPSSSVRISSERKHKKKKEKFYSCVLLRYCNAYIVPFSKWCAYACSISVRDVCAMLNGVVSKAFRDYGTQNHSSEYFLLFFIFLRFSHSPSLSLLTSS